MINEAEIAALNNRSRSDGGHYYRIEDGRIQLTDDERVEWHDVDFSRPILAGWDKVTGNTLVIPLANGRYTPASIGEALALAQIGPMLIETELADYQIEEAP